MAKRILSLLLVLCILAALGGCKNRGEKEPSPGSSGSIDSPALTSDYKFLTEIISLPDDFSQVYNIAYSGSSVYYASGDKLFAMEPEAVGSFELSAYAPLDGYMLHMLGEAHGGGVLALEFGRGNSYIVSFVEPDGTVGSTVDISYATVNFNRFNPSSIFSDAEQNVYFMLDNSVLIVGADGESFCNVISRSGEDIAGIALSGSGTAYICVNYKAEGKSVVYALGADGIYGERLCELPEGTKLVSGGSAYPLLCYDTEALYTLDMVGGKARLLQWAKNNLDAMQTNKLWDIGGDILYYNIMHNMFILREGMEDNRTSLRMAVYNFDNSYIINWVVRDFNAASDKYRIIVDDYAKYDEGVPGAGLLKLNTEIQAGNIPDIIDFAYIPADIYEKNGVLTDLYPFIDSDSELSRSDFLESYMKNFEQDGKLYQALMFFYMGCFVGKTAVVGPEHGWTLDEIITLQNKHTPASPAMAGIPRDTAVSLYLGSVYESFIDREAGTCSFDSDEFVEIIEYLATLEENPEDVGLDPVLNNEAIAYPLTVFNLAYLQTLDYVFGDTQYTFKGYPANEGNGISFITKNCHSLGITEACADKEGAWTFVREIYGEANYKKTLGVIPVNKKCLLDMAEEYFMNVLSYIDEETGEEVVYSNHLAMPHLVNNEVIIIPAATQEQLDRFLALIDACDLVWKADNDVLTIIEEELNPFFAGSKSAGDTARVIQSRVMIYVAEKG